MKILIISGSPRKQSYTRVLANLAYEYAKTKYEVNLLDLGLSPIENFKGFEEKYNEYTKKTVKSLESYDVFIICSPIYNGVFSSIIKNLFEHADYETLAGKTAGFILMSGGKISYLQVQGQLTALMAYFEVKSNPKGVFVSTDSFDDNLKLTDKEIEKRVQEVVDETVQIQKP